MNTEDYDALLYFVGEIGEGPPVHRVPYSHGYTWAPHATAPAPQVRQEPREEPHCQGSDNCLCELCRYTRMAPVLKEQEQNWERRRLITQALNAENREIAERAVEHRKLKAESVAHRPLELD